MPKLIIFGLVFVGVAVWMPDAVRAESVPGELLVTLKKQSASIFARGSAPMFRGVSGVKTLRTGSQPVALISIEPGQEQKLIETLQGDARVLAVQPNYVYRAFFSPNDPSFSLQWNLQKVNAPTAWDFDGTAPLYGGDPSVVVAVIDTGVAYEDYSGYLKAPDFAGTTFVAGKDIVNNDDHANDDHGHGTHVAATIAESTNNGLSAAGLAFNSSIMPVKVLDSDGLGTTADIAAGIDFARTNGAKVINLSLGGPSDDPILHAAIQAAVSAGLIVVAAAGNDGVSSLAYPARYDEVMAVGATRYDDALAPYSNSGTGIDIVAPGGDLDVDQNSDGQPDGILQQTCTSAACTSFNEFFFEGTSQATPHVAGAAALLLAGGVNVANVRSVLENSARDVGSSGYDATFGWGVLDINAAFTLALNDTTAPTGSVTIAGGASFTNVLSVTLSVAAADVGSTVSSMAFSNDGSNFSAWETYSTSRANWDLTAYGGSNSEGTKVVTAKFRDAAGNVSAVVTSSISYDHTPPSAPQIQVTAPAPYSATVLLSGIATSVKQFVASWGAATDQLSGLAGYRIALTESANTDLSSGTIVSDQTYTSESQTANRKLYLRVASVDNAGNTNTATFVYLYQQLRVATGTASASGTLTILKPNGSPARRLTPFGTGYRGGIQVASYHVSSGEPDGLVVAPGPGRYEVIVLDQTGKELRRFKPYTKLRPQGMQVASADLDGDGNYEILVAPKRGPLPVEVFSSAGKLQRSFYPFGNSYKGGIALAAGDVNGDGSVSIVTAQMSDRPLVRIFDRRGKRLRQFFGFPKKNSFGLAVAAGDVNGDGKDEVMVAPSEGASQVRILNGKGKLLKQFFALGKKFSGGLRLASGDWDGDGKNEVVISPAKGAAQVKIFNERGRSLNSFFAMPKTFRGGITLTTLR